MPNAAALLSPDNSFQPIGIARKRFDPRDQFTANPLHGRGTGMWCRPKKTRRRRKSTFIPLRTADALELDRWAETPIILSNTRWKAPRRFTMQRSICITTRQGSKAALAVWAKWREWLGGQVAKYELEIDPDDVKGPTIHGLRGTGVPTVGRMATTPTKSQTTWNVAPDG
jgi:hypothetical protein